MNNSDEKKDLEAWYNMVSAANGTGYKETLTVTENPGCYSYLLKNSLREPPVLKELRDEIISEPMAGCSSSADEAQFICLLIQIMNAKKIVEVGVFKGYWQPNVSDDMYTARLSICCEQAK